MTPTPLLVTPTTPLACPLAVITVVVAEIRTVLRAQALKRIQLQLEKGGQPLSRAEQELVESAKAGSKRGRRGSAMGAMPEGGVELAAMGTSRPHMVPADTVTVVTEVGGGGGGGAEVGGGGELFAVTLLVVSGAVD